MSEHADELAKWFLVGAVIGGVIVIGITAALIVAGAFAV